EPDMLLRIADVRAGSEHGKRPSAPHQRSPLSHAVDPAGEPADDLHTVLRQLPCKFDSIFFSVWRTSPRAHDSGFLRLFIRKPSFHIDSKREIRCLTQLFRIIRGKVWNKPDPLITCAHIGLRQPPLLL